MDGLIRRAVVAAGAMIVVLGTGAGVASAAPAPALAWSPSSLDFGTLAPGASSAPQVFTLNNTGGSATSALIITVTSPAFTITADHCTGKSLGPGKSCTVSVTYTAPATAGQSQATLTAAAPGKPAATAALALTGESAKATPAITTTQQPATATAGTLITDQATVTGGDNPTGTVTFTLYDDPNCGTPLLTDPNEALVNGVATSSPIPTSAAFTAYWVASYNGDANNKPVTSGCADEPVTITKAQPAITTTQQPATAAAGTPVADQANVSGPGGGSGTVTFTLYDNANCTGTPLFTVPNVPLVNGVATSTGYTATAAGTDYWVVSYSGDDSLLPATTGCADEPVTISPADLTLSPGTLTGTDPSTGENSYFDNLGSPEPDTPETFTVTNSGSLPSDVIGQLQFQLSDGFSVADSTCLNHSLAPGQSCTFTVEFRTDLCAANPGPFTGTFGVVGTSGFAYIALKLQAACAD